MLRRSRQTGDTIIEVMLAFAVFAMLAVGTIILMNRGTQSAQQALETTLTQEVVASQAEALRYLRESYIANPSMPAPSPAATFKDIIEHKTVGTPSPFGTSDCVSHIPAGSFAIDTANDAKVVGVAPINDASAPSYPQVATVGVTTKGYGLWIEAVKPSSITGPSFIDFHIRACWYSPSGSIPSTTGTILRQYIPGP